MASFAVRILSSISLIIEYRSGVLIPKGIRLPQAKRKV